MVCAQRELVDFLSLSLFQSTNATKKKCVQDFQMRYLRFASSNSFQSSTVLLAEIFVKMRYWHLPLPLPFHGVALILLWMFISVPNRFTDRYIFELLDYSTCLLRLVTDFRNRKPNISSNENDAAQYTLRYLRMQIQADGKTMMWLVYDGFWCFFFSASFWIAHQHSRHPSEFQFGKYLT